MVVGCLTDRKTMLKASGPGSDRVKRDNFVLLVS